MRELHLYAGAGGGILGSLLLGHEIVGAVEIDPYCRRVLVARQADGSLPSFPIFEDVRELDGHDWRGRVDLISAGFPCQPFSTAGCQRGEDDDRNLWPETIRIIREVGPTLAFLENVPGLCSTRTEGEEMRYFGRVLGDLSEAGFNAEWTTLGADDVGAPHRRKRLWILAYTPRDVCAEQAAGGSERERAGPRRQSARADGMANADSGGLQERPELHSEEKQDIACGNPRGGHVGRRRNEVADSCSGRLPGRGTESEHGHFGPSCETQGWWTVEPNIRRVAHGVASRVDRLRALGNGQVPLVAATAFRELRRRLHDARVGGPAT